MYRAGVGGKAQGGLGGGGGGVLASIIKINFSIHLILSEILFHLRFDSFWNPQINGDGPVGEIGYGQGYGGGGVQGQDGLPGVAVIEFNWARI